MRCKYEKNTDRILYALSCYGLSNYILFRLCCTAVSCIFTANRSDFDISIDLYSFATKYCSHHNPKDYPIYDSYVDEVLRFFRSQDHFSAFYNEDLKIYALFKKILNDFREFYGLNQFDLKQIDQYLWQLGKEYFKKDFGKKQNAKEQKDSI